MKETEEQRFVDLLKRDMENFRADPEQMRHFRQLLDARLQELGMLCAEEEPSSGIGGIKDEQKQKKND